jgi:hypothetical protein
MVLIVVWYKKYIYLDLIIVLFFQTEDDELEHFNDEEEFVGFDPERETTKPKDKFDLKMATVSIVIDFI